MEKFTYSAPEKTYRRKTFTLFQTLILYSIWIFVCAGTVFLILNQKDPAADNQLIFIISLMLPTFIGLIITFYIGFNPKGPEADFKMPALETDLSDSSIVRGKVIISGNSKIDVEVIVPNVYGRSANIFEDSGNTSEAVLAYEEMFEFALEEVGRKYPGCKWEEDPQIKES